MTVGTRRDGARGFGQGDAPAGQHSEQYAGKHAATRRKTARWGRRAAIPAVTIAATLAAGAAAYGLTGTSHADPGKLTNAMAVPLSLGDMAHASTGGGGISGTKAITASRPASHRAPRAARPRAAASTPARTAPTAAAATAAKAAAAPETAAPAASATPAASASASHAATTATFTCSASSYLLPENVTAIVSFLIANGYSHNAAAGIAGNIYQESKGDPESVGMGGGGLIGWTPLPSGFVTGNPAADLQTQLNAILTFNQEWASYIPALNAAATPAAAADIYVTDFERAGIPAASTREASAQAVATACAL